MTSHKNEFSISYLITIEFLLLNQFKTSVPADLLKKKEYHISFNLLLKVRKLFSKGILRLVPFKGEIVQSFHITSEVCIMTLSLAVIDSV